MNEVTAADSERNPQPQSALLGVLLVAAALAFVTALIVLSGEASPAWFLYLLPIVIGALAYGVGGGVLVTALSVVALLLAAPSSARAGDIAELVTGFSAFLICGVVVGVQARRQRTHRAALEQASVVDPLTGVLRADHFIARIAEEIRRADRYSHDVGLVFVRVEGFDEFMRVFGHYKAESMIRHLCDIIRLSARDTDVIGRLGDATFGIVLLHADLERSQQVAERVMRTTGAAQFEGDALEPITACLTTAAAASHPRDVSGVDDVLAAAIARAEQASVTSPSSGLPGRPEVALP